MFHVIIETDNDTFHPNARMEICTILRDIIKRVDDGNDRGKCWDTNGNSCGTWELNDE